MFANLLRKIIQKQWEILPKDSQPVLAAAFPQENAASPIGAHSKRSSFWSRNIPGWILPAPNQNRTGSVGSRSAHWRTDSTCIRFEPYTKRVPTKRSGRAK